MRKLGLGLLILVLFMVLIQPQQTQASSKGQELVNFGVQFEGTPYQWGGTTPAGFDCSGYIRYVYGNYGIDMPRTSAAQYGVGEPVSRNNLQPGDLVFFSNTYKPGISHTGIYVGNNRFISAKSSGVRIVSLNNTYWGPRYTGARRVIEEPKPDPKPVVKSEPEPDPEPQYKQLPTGQYHDIRNDHWAADEIKALSERGIIRGFPNSFFRPEEGITRAQAAIMVNRELELNADTNNAPEDVGSRMAGYSDILALLDNDIMTLQDNGSFGPDTPVSREEMAVIFHKAFELSNDIDVASVDLPLTDVSPEEESYEAIVALYDKGVTQGYTDNTFRPDVTTTRGHFTAFLHRILN